MKKIKNIELKEKRGILHSTIQLNMTNVINNIHDGDNMKNSNKVLIFSLFLVLFIGLSAVSAADADDVIASDANPDSGNLKAIDVKDNSDASSDIVSSANEEILADSGDTVAPISFSDLQSKVRSSSKINLDSDVTFKSGDSKGGIMIAKSVTINGNGHTIDAKGKTRVFKVAGTLTLTNVNIINGYMAGENGGAILNSGTLKLTNSNFKNCKVTGSKISGGAIAGAGGGNIVNCKFIKCSAPNLGGAVYSNKLKFNKCDFTSNTAGCGGAIGGKAYIYNSNFKNCKSTKTKSTASKTDGGGACSGEFPRVEGCTFTNCKATNGGLGGAIRGTTNTYNCKFINCAAKEGGAIRGKGTTVGCTFEKCFATSKMGGAIFTEKTTINKCKFIECSAKKSHAGAVYVGNNAKITNCKFTGCSAPKGFGGAVYGNGVVVKCTFNKNKANGGGAVSSYSLTVKSSTFTANSAYKGGAAYNVKSIVSCKFSKNKATYGNNVYRG